MIARVWTFLLRGGQPFTLQGRGSPPLEHDGNLSVQAIVGTTAEKDSWVQAVHPYGVDVFVYGEVQNDAQQAEREILLGLGGPIPCLKCMTCSWYDPRLPLTLPDSDGCGLPVGVPHGSDDPKAIADAAECPLQR